MPNVTLVNNYYPVTYFATANLDQVAPNAPNTFWASKQEFAPEAEELVYDFGQSRPVNFIDFEIAQKPVDIAVYYDDGTGTWVEATPAPEFDTSMSVQYIASVENPWTYFEFHFNVVETRYVKVVLTRRVDPFPFLDSDPIEFSIEVRNLRLMHVISTLEEFLPDSGTDILGNTYRTDAQSYSADNVIGGNPGNLSRDSSFESPELNAWGLTAAGFSVISSDSFEGTHCLKAFSATTNNTTISGNSIDFIQVDISAPYILSGYFKKVSGGAVTQPVMRLQMYDANYNPLGFTYPNVAVTGATFFGGHFNPPTTWTRYAGMYSGQAGVSGYNTGGFIPGTKYVQIQVYGMYNNDVAPTEVHIDAIQLEQSPTLSTYIRREEEGGFWQSQPNPTPYAVEALYFDLRQTPKTGTMTVLDSIGMSDLTTRGMADVETYYEDGILLDEIFIDPITTGPHMHIYYSIDDEPDWDNKLWSPVARHYILKKGFHALPRPMFVKYLKLEFSNLVPAPYNMPEYPQLPQLTYLRYPTWVQNYFNNTYISKPSGDQFFDPYDHVTIDPLELGFQRQLDNLNSGLEIRSPITVEETDTEIKNFVSGLVATQTTATEAQTVVESTIKFNTSWMWQNDLIAQMDTTRFLSRIAQAGETGFNAETTPYTLPPPTTQSVADLSQAKAEKEHPIMWFPLRCRHAYQVVKADRPAQVAFFVAIRSITFHRRDYTVPYDEAFYIETFDDTTHQASNDFIQDDWRFVVTP